MSFTWKDTAATIGLAIIAVITIALMSGFMESVDARWALGSFVLFLIAGLTGLITGTAKIMQRAWSAIALYILTAGVLVITVINAFLNSETWFVALAINITLIWLEFVAIDLLSHETTPGAHTSVGGTV